MMEGAKWAVCQRWIAQACINAGIPIPTSAYLTNINTDDTEGVKWCKLQAWLALLANNISGGGGGTPSGPAGGALGGSYPNPTSPGASGGNSVLVDATGVASPYTTIAAGIAAATGSRGVTVLPGTYTDKNINTSVPFINFAPGAFWSVTTATGTDRALLIDATHNPAIYGKGHFRITNSAATTGDIASPSFFGISGGVTANIQFGVYEGYQTDASKIGQNFLAAFDVTAGNNLYIICDSIGGNIPLGNLEGVAITGCFGLFYTTSTPTVFELSNFTLNCNTSIQCKYDANGNSSNQQYIGRLIVNATNDFYVDKLLAWCAASSGTVAQDSFYRCVNLYCNNLLACFNTKSSSIAHQFQFFYASRIKAFDVASNISLYSIDTSYVNDASVEITAQINIDTAHQDEGGCFLNFDTSQDTTANTSLYIFSKMLYSQSVVKLYGETMIGVFGWYTNGLGFDSGPSGNDPHIQVTPGCTVDAGFATGNACIIAGEMTVNGSAF